MSYDTSGADLDVYRELKKYTADPSRAVNVAGEQFQPEPKPAKKPKLALPTTRGWWQLPRVLRRPIEELNGRRRMAAELRLLERWVHLNPYGLGTTYVRGRRRVVR